MNEISKKFGLILLLSILIPGCFLFQALGQSQVGTTVGQFLKIEPSSRGAALGNSGASLSGEATFAFYNPAALGRLQKTSLQFTHSDWLADIDYNFAAAAVRLGRIGTFSLQITSLNSGEIDVRTVDQPQGTGERYDVTNFALGIGYGLMLTHNVSVGVQFNYLRESIWHSTLTGASINLGVQYRLYEDGPTLGASVSNFGPRASYNGRDLFIDHDLEPNRHGDNDQLPAELRTEEYALPTMFRVGVSYPIKLGNNNSLLVAADAMHPNDNYESINLGAEWQLWDSFALRGGYRDLFLTDAEGGLVLGAGLQVGVSGYHLHFDYSWADYGILEQTQRFTLGLRF